MDKKGIMARPEWQMRICPYCGKDLGRMEIWKQKIGKVCRCSACGTVIDERNMIR